MEDWACLDRGGSERQRIMEAMSRWGIVSLILDGLWFPEKKDSCLQILLIKRDMIHAGSKKRVTI